VHSVGKKRAAREALARRFHSRFAAGHECLALLDVLRVTCREDPTPALKEIPTLRSLKKLRLKRKDPATFQAYGRAHWFVSTTSKTKCCVESDRQGGWLAPFAVSLFADDRTGLLPRTVMDILALLPRTRLILIELALDFSLVSHVTRAFTRRHAVFGKSWRDLSRNNPAVDWWGARRGAKRVKSYRKDEVAAHRVEFRVRRRFLNTYGVKDVFDFHRLVEILPHRHILFARLDRQNLIARLRRSGRSEPEILGVLREVAKRDGDLWTALRYLRSQVALKNARRLLVPLPENAMVREALKRWAKEWPRTPRRLE
jgi:hypothetical protein